MTSARRNPLKSVAIGVALLVWLAAVGAWMANALDGTVRLDRFGLEGRYIRSEPLYDAVFGVAALCGLALAVLGRAREGVARYARYSFAFPLLWQASVYFADRLYWPVVRVKLADLGLAGLFLLGLGWLVWYVERRWNEYARTTRGHEFDDGPRPRFWSPFHPEAWYYGRRNGKLHQSLAILTNYAVLFFALVFLSTQLGGCEEIFDLPAGGGKQTKRAQTVKIQVKKVNTLVFNPYSSIIFKDRNLDDVKMDLKKATAHQHQIGQGDGDGQGYGGKNPNAKIRFIRLEYPGGDWAQDTELNPDLNLLISFNVQTGQKIVEKPESMYVGRLGNFRIGSAPPLVYMTGKSSISLNRGEVQDVRKYLIENHGMLFMDNGGGNFEGQAFAMMRQIVPEIEPVKIPLDDIIHSTPNEIPFLPYVSFHGGRRDAYGWKLDGRWIAYYHPGDIGDAWSDGHSGVPQTVWEACYDLGVNVINYAYSENAKWRIARGSQ